MFGAVLGLFSQDLAVDFGTSTTRFYQRGAGVVCDEPTVVSVQTDSRGRRGVLAIGGEAKQMLGRTPADITAIQPVRDGQIHDYEVAEALLLHLIRRVHGRSGWVSPRMVVAVPHGATEMERRAVRESCETAGAREVHLVPKPLAGALGAQLQVNEPSGHMLVDIGGGTTEISVLSMLGVVSSHTIQGGGGALDQAVMRSLRKRHELLVGQPTAEALKIELGAAAGRDPNARRIVKGRCLLRGVPKAIEVSAQEIAETLEEQISQLAGAIRHVLERTSPELASDIVDQGVVLIGGGSRLWGLDSLLRRQTGLPVVCSEHPHHAVVMGTGQILEEFELLRKVAS